jgi:hypothetical protein
LQPRWGQTLARLVDTLADRSSFRRRSAVDLIHERFDAAFRISDLADSGLIATPGRRTGRGYALRRSTSNPVPLPDFWRPHECRRLSHPKISNPLESLSTETGFVPPGENNDFAGRAAVRLGKQSI